MTDVDGDDLTDEGEKDDVISNEDEIQITLFVANVRVGGRGDRVRDEEKRSKRVWETLGDKRGEKLPIDIKNGRYQEEYERGSWGRVSLKGGTTRRT